jgi:flagellar FliL protein
VAEDTKKEGAKKDEPKKDDKEAKAEGGAGAEGAEGGEGGEAAAEAPKGKFGKKKIIIIAAAAVLVLAGGGGAAFFFLHGKSDKPDQPAAAAEDAKPVYFSLGDLLVNLSGEGKHPNFLKVKITLELTDEKDVPLMENIKPRIMDNFQVYLRELRIEDLRGSAGMYRLREELLTRVTEAAQPIRVRDVLFQEMLVQ